MTILELKDLRNNVDNQCVPIGLYVTLSNQFHGDKRVSIKDANFRNIKKWVDWGAKHHKQRAKLQNPREKKYFDELFKGNWNIETFHQELNQHIRKGNLRLQMSATFSFNDIKTKLEKGFYCMVLIDPKYIMDKATKYDNPKKKTIRGDNSGNYHFIVIHGSKNENLLIYDSDLHHKKGEVLSATNIRCQTPFATLQKYCNLNRLYWFEPIEKSSSTSLNIYQK